MQNHQEMLRKEIELAEQIRKRLPKSQEKQVCNTGVIRKIIGIYLKKITGFYIKELGTDEEYVYMEKELARQISICLNNTNGRTKISSDAGLMAQRATLFAIRGQEYLIQDVEAVIKSDPAATSTEEVLLAYPGVQALAIFRFAHFLHEMETPIIPRMMTEIVHRDTGIDIHPAATIGSFCAIDHGTGLVIGETTVIGDWVKLYHGVTLGAKSVDPEDKNKKRHPTIGDNVTIYPGATILGDIEIGDNCIIGGNAMLLKPLKANQIAKAVPATMDVSKR